MAAAAHELHLHLHHEAVNMRAGEHLRGPWHTQNVNAHYGSQKSCLARFQGMATSYLENYLGWFCALDRASKNRQESAPMLALARGLGQHH